MISGFVLRLALERDARAGTELAASFALRRFFRIWPALAVNVLAMFALSWLLRAGLPGLYPPGHGAGALLENLTLAGVPVNGATWSLQVELLAVPFLRAAHFAARRYGPRAYLVFALFLVLALFHPRLLFRFRLVTNTLFMFGLGTCIPDLAPRLLASLSRARAAALLGLGVSLLLGARFVIGYASKWSYFCEGLGGAIVVALVAFGPALRPIRWLDPAPVRALGRVSYSFYLYHPLFLSTVMTPILAIVWSEGSRREWPLAIGLALAALTIPPALVAAGLSFRSVERTGTAFGRRREDRLARRLARAAGAA